MKPRRPWGAGERGQGPRTNNHRLRPVTVGLGMVGAAMQSIGDTGRAPLVRGASAVRVRQAKQAEPAGSARSSRPSRAGQAGQASTWERSACRAVPGGLRRACPAGRAGRAARQCRLGQYLCMRFRCKAYGGCGGIHAEAMGGQRGEYSLERVAAIRIAASGVVPRPSQSPLFEGRSDFGRLGHRTTRPLDHWTTGPLDRWTAGPLNHGPVERETHSGDDATFEGETDLGWPGPRHKTLPGRPGWHPIRRDGPAGRFEPGPEACRNANTVVFIQPSFPWDQPARLHPSRGALLRQCASGAGRTSPRTPEWRREVFGPMWGLEGQKKGVAC
jgi:hypothetical protein